MAFDANDLSPHEHFVVERTRLGEIADFSPLGGADGSKPGVRAGFLRRLMLGLEAEWRAPATGLRIRGARIDGALDLSDCSGETLPALTLDQCVIADVIDISHARLARLALTGCAVRRVAAGGAHIGGDLDLSGARPLGPPGKEALTVDLRGADIGGALLFSGAKLARGDSGHEALIAEGARVVGDIRFDAGFESFGALVLSGARIGGALVADGATLLNRTDDAAGAAIAAQGVSLAGAARFSRCKAEGVLNFAAAQIGACADFTGAALRNEFGAALTLAGAQALEVLLNASKISGQVNLSGARIAHGLDLRGGEIAHPLSPRAEAFGIAIDGASVRIGADARLEGANIKGETRLQHARIGGGASFGGGRFLNGGGCALSADGVELGADMTFAIVDGYAPHGQKTVIEGAASFTGAKLGGRLAWRGMELRGPSPAGDKGGLISLADAHIAGALQAHAMTTHQDARIDLRGARCEALEDDVKAGWGSETAKLELDGLHYARFGEGDAQRTRVAWLRRANARASAYETAAAAYAAAGQRADARRMLLAGRDATAARESTGLISWTLASLYGVLAGHGLSPLRMVRALVLFFALGVAGVFAMNAQGALVTPQGRACNGAVEPALYAADVATPFLDLGQQGRCGPGRTARADLPAGIAVGEDDWRVFEGVAMWRWAHALYAMLGFILSALALVTFTGAAARYARRPR